MDLETYRDQLVADFKTIVPVPRIKVEPHPGRFDLQELHSYSINAPCIRVAVLLAADAESSETVLAVDAAAYVVTKATREGSPDRQLLRIGTALLQAIRRFRDFGGVDTQRPSKLRFTNLYNGRLGDEQIALGSIGFTQKFELTDAPGELESFQRLFGDLDIGGDGSAPESQSQTHLQGA